MGFGYRKRATPAPGFGVPTPFGPISGMFAPIANPDRPPIWPFELYDDIEPIDDYTSNYDDDGYLAWPLKIDDNQSYVRDDTVETPEGEYMTLKVGPHNNWRAYGKNHTYTGGSGDPKGAYVWGWLSPDGWYYIIGGQKLAKLILVEAPDDVDASGTFTVTEVAVLDDGQDPTGGVSGEVAITNWGMILSEGEEAVCVHDGDGGYRVISAAIEPVIIAAQANGAVTAGDTSFDIDNVTVLWPVGGTLNTTPTSVAHITGLPALDDAAVVAFRAGATTWKGIPFTNTSDECPE